MTATLVREPAAHLSPLERLEVLCDPGQRPGDALPRDLDQAG